MDKKIYELLDGDKVIKVLSAKNTLEIVKREDLATREKCHLKLREITVDEFKNKYEYHAISY